MRKDMTWKQKIEYFKDYYLFQTVCIAAAITVVGLLIWHFAIRDDEPLLYVAVVNGNLETEEKEAFQKGLAQELKTDAEKIMIDHTFSMEGDGLHKLEIYLKSSQIDVLIAGQADFKRLCGYGFLKPLDQAFPEDIRNMHEDQVVRAPGYLENSEISFQDHETGQGEICAYGFLGLGLSINETGGTSSPGQEPVIGIAESSKRVEDAVKCVSRLCFCFTEKGT